MSDPAREAPTITTVQVHGETIYRVYCHGLEVRSPNRAEVEAWIKERVLPAGYHGPASDF